jgi:heme export protein D (CcmD)
MNHFKKFLIFIVFVLLIINLQAQDSTDKVTMADTMRSNGRIYVVIAVILTILFGLLLYMVRLERKINRLEKQSHL